MSTGEIERLLAEARKANLAGQYEDALELNERVAALGEPLGLRFAGVCLFRLERLQESEARLRAALEEVPPEQRPYVHNHLGATLRRLGRIAEAKAIFEAGIALAGTDQSARGRLFGNLGALYDELGEEDRAIDCYGS